MVKNRSKSGSFGALFLIVILLFTVIAPAISSTDIDRIKGFEKGIPWQPFKPLKKVTFVNFDKDTLIDDYAYLASIPASVFSDGKTLFSSPLLFYQPDNTYPDDEEYRFLNDYDGTHYLMQDWMSYCNGKLDKITAINVHESNLDPDWRSSETTFIDSDDPFDVASKIALDEWSYSDDVVIAVIEEDYEKPTDTKTTGSIDGEISGKIGTDSFTIKRPYGPASEYECFTVENEYKYVELDLWYPSFVINFGVGLNNIPGFGGAAGITLPSVDPDIQIYCKYEGDWLQTAGESNMAITGGPHEECSSYVYTPGEWRVSVTNMPTEGGDESFINNGPLGKGKIKRYGSFKDAVKNLLFDVTSFNIDITKYPGVELEIPELPPFGCRDANFKLSWDNENVDLGLTLIGLSGEEIDSVMKKDTDSQEIHLDQMGEGLEGEHYRVVVYALDDVSTPTDFTVEYSWQQNITRKEADLLASACQGAILGSIKNKPLLYTKPDELPDCTIDTLYKLGVEKIDVVDLGGYLTEETKDELSNIVEINEHYTEYKRIYTTIMEHTGSNDVIFSTVDPWSYWYYKSKAGQLKPDGEFEKAFHFGPAAYAAAHHGSPLLLVDNHPELSGAITWHGDFWRKHASGYALPPIACMFLTGSRVYDFLGEYGFDKEGLESILTVAGQYEIGPTWSRVFAGVGNPGIIIGTPVDASNHIARCIYYPGLIFQNPALNGAVKLETGSESERVQSSVLRPLKRFWGRLSPSTPGLSNLKITKPSRVEEFEYPVLHTYGCYSHRFNERASKYWGITYQTRTGHTPGVDISGQEIDEGVREKFEGKAGSFLPDMSDSEIAPFYATKAGYSNAFSTNFEVTIDNLNQGVISWYMVLHGDSGQGGWLAWWRSMDSMLTEANVPQSLANIIGKSLGAVTGSNPHEPNPWRCYDMLWGSTTEPDSATLNSKIGFLVGLLGIGNPDGPLNGGIFKTGLDIVPANIPLFKFLGNRENYFDGLIGPYSITAMLTKFSYSHPATEVDDKLENLHSMDFHAGSCLIGCNYLQISLMRHGSVLQECDPWPTSYWAGYPAQQIPREYALGKTVGETYTHGLGEIGVKYLFEENEDRIWWWDTAENMVLFADPDLRIWVPSTEWDEEAKNNWARDDIVPLRYDAELDVDGHMPFGATGYPHEKEPLPFWLEYLAVIIIIVAFVILLLVGVVIRKKK